MTRSTRAAALFAAAALAAGLCADEPKKPDAKDAKDAKAEAKPDLKKLMGAAHRGEKSPHARLVAELNKDAPDWAEVAKSAKAFAETGAHLKGRGAYTSPAAYIAGANDLTKAAGEKDKRAATEAFAGLRKTCSACHHYGGAAPIRFNADGTLK